MERMGARAAQAFLSLTPALAHGADISEITGLVGLAEKMGVVAILVVALYISFREIMAGRGRAHALRNQLVNCNVAREMWKTAYFGTGTNAENPWVKTMLEREERLLQQLEVV